MNKHCRYLLLPLLFICFTISGMGFEKEIVQAPNTHPFLFKLNKALGPVSLELKNLEQVKLVIKTAQLNVNEGGKDDQTVLHYLATKQIQELYPVLLELGGDVNTKDANYRTPLHIAASIGNTYAFNLLIEKGANVNLKDNKKDTALHLAARNGYTELVSILVKRKDLAEPLINSSFNTPLDEAIEYSNNEEVVWLLIESGVSTLNYRDTNFTSPLLKACLNNKLPIIRLLITYPTLQVNQVNKEGNTALHIAANKKSSIMAELLLNSSGINPNIYNKSGLTPLMIAIEKNHLDFIKQLINDMRTDLDCLSTNPALNSALYMAYKNCSEEIFKLLIFRGARIDLPTPESYKIGELIRRKSQIKIFFKKFSSAKRIASASYKKVMSLVEMNNAIIAHQELFLACEQRDRLVLKKIATTCSFAQHHGTLPDTPLHFIIRNIEVKNNVIEKEDLELFFYLLYINPKLLDKQNKNKLTPCQLIISLGKFILLEILLKALSGLSVKNTGISTAFQKQIVSFIAAIEPEARIFLYGDRVLQKFNEKSPIELVIDYPGNGENKNFEKIRQVLRVIDTKDLITIQVYNKLKKKEKKNILLNGIVWYEPARS